LPGLAGGRYVPRPDLGPDEPAEQVGPPVLVSGQPVDRGQRLFQQGHRPVVRVAVLGQLGRPDGIVRGQRRRLDRGRLGVVVGQGAEVVRPDPLEDGGDPAVHAGPAQVGEVGVEGVADQRVREPHPTRGRFAEQAGDDPGLQGVVHRVLVGVGRRYQDVDLGLTTDHRGQPEHGDRRRRKPGQPAAEHVADPLGHLGQRDQDALAGQEPRALPHVERVATGALGQRLDRRPVQRPAVHRGQDQVDLVEAQPGQRDPLG
jgi:hypothetical protein